MAVFNQAFGNNTADSLAGVLERTKSDTARVRLMNEISSEYKTTDFDKAFSYAKQAMELSERLGFLRGRVNSLNNLGGAYYNKGDYDQAIEYHKKGYELSRENKYQMGMAVCLNSLGIDYHNKGLFPKATEYYFQSLKISEEIGEERVSASSYNGIANIYYSQGSLDKALDYHKRSLKIKEHLKDLKGVATSMNNIGLCYQDKKDFGLAEFYYTRSLMLREEIDDKKGIASCLTNLGRLYYDQKAYDQALGYFKKARDIREETNDKRGLAVIMDYMGDAYAGKGDMVKAEELLLQAESTAEEIGARNIYSGIYQSLAEIYEKKKDFQKAYKYEQKLRLINAELMSAEGADYVEQLQVLAEKEKQEQELVMKQKEIELNEANLQKKNTIIYAGVAGSILLLILAFFIYRGYVHKKKANLELEEKNLLIEIKNKDITDSINYARRIQQAILPSSELIRKTFSDAFILFMPKDIVSGDFYWAAAPSAEGDVSRFYMAVGDSTGHGVPGAFMSLLNISYLNEAVAEKRLQRPNEILDHVRKRLIENVSHDGGQDGMDGILLCVENSGNDISVSYAASNNPPLLLSRSALEEQDYDKMPIGFSDKTAPFNLFRPEVRKGEVLYLFTDGFADQFGGKDGKKMKSRKFHELLMSVSSLPFDSQKEKLESEFHAWKGNLDQVDDVLVIGIRI